ncbi:MAG: L-threonylcarbamoyladenylate synthase [Thermoanaerobaculaceae bacterium]
MMVLPFRTERDLQEAVPVVQWYLSRSQVVAIPTETFYGLAVSPEDAQAVERLFAIKGREVTKALPLVGASLEQLEVLVVIPAPWRARLRGIWPAPLSVVVAARRPIPACGPTAAVRVPAHPLLRQLLAVTGPLTATSANLAGNPPAQTVEELAPIAQGLELALDGGATPGGLPSTLLDLTTTPPRVLRPGAFPVPEQWFLEGATLS